jgi:Xaa-Pro dipeptidase
VHDVGGHQAGPGGGTVPPPEEHPFLRNTRLLEPGHVVTIEPGVYFIPVLLDPLRATPEGSLVNWDLVAELLPCGGVRIEDNVFCTEEGPLDFTRDLIPGP